MAAVVVVVVKVVVAEAVVVTRGWWLLKWPCAQARQDLERRRTVCTGREDHQ